MRIECGYFRILRKVMTDAARQDRNWRDVIGEIERIGPVSSGHLHHTHAVAFRTIRTPICTPAASAPLPIPPSSSYSCWSTGRSLFLQRVCWICRPVAFSNHYIGARVAWTAANTGKKRHSSIAPGLRAG